MWKKLKHSLFLLALYPCTCAVFFALELMPMTATKKVEFEGDGFLITVRQNGSPSFRLLKPTANGIDSCVVTLETIRKGTRLQQVTEYRADGVIVKEEIMPSTGERVLLEEVTKAHLISYSANPELINFLKMSVASIKFPAPVATSFLLKIGLVEWLLVVTLVELSRFPVETK